MTSISTAVSTGRVSAVVGYEIDATLKGITAGKLPQRIVILGEKSALNQTAEAQLNFTSAQEVGDEYGYTSPLYAVARILRPFSGNKLGSIPTICLAVDEAAGATETVITKSITGTATKNATHKLIINGRTQLDGQSYSFVVEAGDTNAEISAKMAAAANAVLGCPVIGSVDTNQAVFTTGWAGATSAEVNIEIDTNGDAAGLTYAEVSKVDGAGAPSVTTALAEIGDSWATMLINCFNSDSDVLDALEAYNGNANDKTGRYEPTVFKPLIALFGDNSADTLTEVSAITDSRKNEMTNVFCPAPNSDGLSFEAAANVAFVYAPIAQETPNVDPIGKLYPDMPVATDIGDFADVTVRDSIVKVGGSTVKLNGEKYEIIDLVTTSHPDNEPQTAVLFRWVRDIVGLDWNIRYMYMLLEEIYVKGKTIVVDGQTVTAEGTISPNRWKAILTKQFGPTILDNALMADLDYFAESLQVQIGESNPNRFETAFECQRTGTARVLSTTNKTQFKFS